MHIDFAPPSNGTYNNAGSSRQLANYLEHEDLERIEKGIYTEGFFNLTEDVYKRQHFLTIQPIFYFLSMSATQTLYPFRKLREPLADIRKGSLFNGYYFHTFNF